MERGWQKRLAKGWRKVGEGLAQGWRRVGEELADFFASSNFGIPEALAEGTPTYTTMLGAYLSDQIPGGPNLTLTLTLNSK